METLENLATVHTVVMRKAMDVMDQAKAEILRLRAENEALLEAAKIGLVWVENEEGSNHDDSDFIKATIARAEAVRS